MKALAPKIARLPRTDTVRVAIYARQSVEDARSPFNSIQAQREAVEAYVRSQTERGWRAIEKRYDDPACSGSTLKRPALQELLADIEAHRVDVVAVYKFDRLSRSQMDFLRTVEHLRERNVSFVSITQAFDTETITGRAMLGILGVFGQMERETIAERTRDKVHATRRKGMWSGGMIPLGYDLCEGRLAVNEPEATQVRSLFAHFVEHHSTLGTVDFAAAKGIATKGWTTKEKTAVEPRPFTKSTMRALLSNPIFVGRVRLGEETHAGVHEPILDTATWDAAQEALTQRDTRAATTHAPKHNVLLRGLIHCRCGSLMVTAWTRRGPVTHGSYVCLRASKQGTKACPKSRVPLSLIEGAIVERIRLLARDPTLVEATIEAAHRALVERGPELEREAKRLVRDAARVERERANVLSAIAAGETTSLRGKLVELDGEAARLSERITSVGAERQRLEEAQIDPDEVRRVMADFDTIWSALFHAERARIVGLIEPRITYDGRTSTVTIGDDSFRLHAPRAPKPPKQEPHEPRRRDRGAQQLALSYRLDAALESGELRDHAHAAEVLGVTRARVSQVTALRYLAPDLQARLLDGDHSIPERALRRACTFVNWDEQRAAIQEYRHEDPKRRRESARAPGQDRRDP